MCLLWSVSVAKAKRKRIFQFLVWCDVCATITAKYFPLFQRDSTSSSVLAPRIMHRMRRVLIYERHLPSKTKTGKKHFRRMLRGRKMASGANSSAPPRNCFHFLKWKHAFLRGNPLQSQQVLSRFLYYVTSYFLSRLSHYKKLSL